MKIYRLDCSGSYRIVFQFKNYNVFTRLREWYKFKRRINRLNKQEITTMYELVADEIARVEREMIFEKPHYNSTNELYISHLRDIYNKIL